MTTLGILRPKTKIVPEDKCCIIGVEGINVKIYPVIIEQEGDGYIVSCPIFEGCYSQGNTIDEVYII